MFDKKIVMVTDGVSEEVFKSSPTLRKCADRKGGMIDGSKEKS
jgi:hypothetical protein